jgi:hypothetical protein
LLHFLLIFAPFLAIFLLKSPLKTGSPQRSQLLFLLSSLLGRSVAVAVAGGSTARGVRDLLGKWLFLLGKWLFWGDFAMKMGVLRPQMAVLR